MNDGEFSVGKYGIAVALLSGWLAASCAPQAGEGDPSAIQASIESAFPGLKTIVKADHVETALFPFSEIFTIKNPLDEPICIALDDLGIFEQHDRARILSTLTILEDGSIAGYPMTGDPAMDHGGPTFVLDPDQSIRFSMNHASYWNPEIIEDYQGVIYNFGVFFAPRCSRLYQDPSLAVPQGFIQALYTDARLGEGRYAPLMYNRDWSDFGDPEGVLFWAVARSYKDHRKRMRAYARQSIFPESRKVENPEFPDFEWIESLGVNVKMLVLPKDFNWTDRSANADTEVAINLQNEDNETSLCAPMHFMRGHVDKPVFHLHPFISEKKDGRTEYIEEQAQPYQFSQIEAFYRIRPEQGFTINLLNPTRIGGDFNYATYLFYIPECGTREPYLIHKPQAEFWNWTLLLQAGKSDARLLSDYLKAGKGTLYWARIPIKSGS